MNTWSGATALPLCLEFDDTSAGGDAEPFAGFDLSEILAG
jgi:hypothetical protein